MELKRGLDIYPDAFPRSPAIRRDGGFSQRAKVAAIIDAGNRGAEAEHISWLRSDSLDSAPGSSRRLARRFPQRSANHTLRAGMRPRSALPPVRNYNRAHSL
jgi:hypothetical protein